MKHLKQLLEYFKSVLSPFVLMRGNTLSIIKFELIYRIMALLIFFPVFSWMQRLLLIVNGTKVVAAFNLNSFMGNPLTWVVLLLMVIFLTVVASFERFAVTDTLHASRCGLHRTTGQIFLTAFDLTIVNLRPRNWLMIIYCTVILHFGSIYDVSSITSFINIPGYMLESMEKYPWQKAIYIVGIALCVYLLVRWIFAIPIMMEEDNTHFSKACRMSAQMVKGHYMIHAGLLIGFWSLFAFALFYLGASVFLAVWYVIGFWLTSGGIGSFVKFYGNMFEPVSIILFIVFTWIMMPIILASIQTAFYKRKEELGLKIHEYTEEYGYFKKHEFLRVFIWGVFVVCVFFSGPKRYRQVTWMMNTDVGEPLIMAHRGYSEAAPENTLPAFTKAIDAGFTAAELDVQMTKDGVIVVMHDSNLKRTTGVNKNIWDVTYDEIKDLDSGSFFSKEYEGTTIPTLDEVLKTCKDKLFLNIEIKRTGHDDGITEKVIEIIRENEYADECDITSQNYATLEEVREIDPGILTAYTSIIGLGDIQKLDAADMISIQQTFASYGNIEKIHNAGKRVFVWTVNEADTMETLVSLNVDAILTNDPDLCQSVIDRYASNVMNIVRRIQHALTYVG